MSRHSNIENGRNLCILLVIGYLMYISFVPITSNKQIFRSISVVKSSSFGDISTAKGRRSYEQLEEELFKPLGYKLIEKTIIPSLRQDNPQTCDQVFTEWLKLSENQNESATPPKKMPASLRDKYLLNGYSDLMEGYMDDRSGTHYLLWANTIDMFIAKNISQFENYGNEGVGMYYAMKYMGLNNQTGAVIGSLTPWVEAFAFKNGAKKVITMEYARISISESDKLSYMHPVEVAKDYKNQIGQYDFIATFSSIEHSGLGRFGDALDPDGDIQEVRKIACMLKEGGVFFLGIPFGNDTVYFNLHRIYGRIRLAIMLTGFELLHIFYADSVEPLTPEIKLFEQPGTEKGGHHQLVLVLRKI